MARHDWSPRRPQDNPFVMLGSPNFTGGRFEERQQLIDWLHSSGRNPLLLGGVRGAGKTTLTAWLTEYLEFDPYEHFDDDALTPVFARGNTSDSLLAQLSAPEQTTVTSEVGGQIFGVGGRRSESTTHPNPRSLLDLFPSGHLIVVDEAQSLSAEQLGEIAHFLETPGPEYSGKVLMAGTPELFYIHPSDGTFGVFGRCPQIRLSATQSLEETTETLVGTVELGSANKRFTDEAIEFIHGMTGGYPTAVQIAGYYSYRAARDVIDVKHVDLSPGSPAGRQLATAFDQMLRRQGERGRHPALRSRVLRILADGPATTAQIAAAADKSDPKGVAPALDHLRRVGLAEPDANRLWHISVPLLDQHILRNEVGVPDTQRSSIPAVRRDPPTTHR